MPKKKKKIVKKEPEKKVTTVPQQVKMEANNLFCSVLS